MAKNVVDGKGGEGKLGSGKHRCRNTARRTHHIEIEAIMAGSHEAGPHIIDRHRYVGDQLSAAKIWATHFRKVGVQPAEV